MQFCHKNMCVHCGLVPVTEDFTVLAKRLGFPGDVGAVAR